MNQKESMYFKSSMRPHPETGELSGYYRLVESYRNSTGRVCHRTILNVGYMEGIAPEQLNVIQKILTQRAKQQGEPLLDIPVSDDKVVIATTERLYNQMIAEKRIDVPSAGQKPINPDLIDSNSIENGHAREVGAEWLSYQALKQLGLERFLRSQGWETREIQLALTQIISRAVYPASESKTSRWIQENSSVCEITQFPIEQITKDKLYQMADKLYEHKDSLEQHLSHRTNELFDIQDKILLYDLTNTYFEGRYQESEKAWYGRSKEKRSDAKLVVLALVINPEGFIKYSNVYKGNMADCKTLTDMIERLRYNTSVITKKALVVIDAGIATDDNLKMIREKGYDYLCVSRSALKKYDVNPKSQTVTVTDKKKQTIQLIKVTTTKNTDFYLKVNSEAKEKKERSMKTKFTVRFEEELKKISASLQKKGGVKQEDKVHQRIGRLKQKYPSVQRYYEITTQVEEKITRPRKKSKEGDNAPKIKRIVTKINRAQKEEVVINERSGVYFLRTSLTDTSEQNLWLFYNTIREIEATFRVLKTDLDLRPVYHKTDKAIMSHLHLGLLAYWVVNTIRYQLKTKNIKSDWREIVRTMNTQKAVTTIGQNTYDQYIIIRKCTHPTKAVREIYDAIGYKYTPFAKRKSVVHKQKFRKSQFFDSQYLHPK